MVTESLVNKTNLSVSGTLFLIVFLWFFWIILSDDLSFLSIVGGGILAVILSIVTHFFLFKKNRISRKSLKESLFALEHLFSLLLSTFVRLIESNLLVIYQAITLRIYPKIVKLKINVQSDFEITLISTLITLTPGTLVIDVEDAEDGGSYLYVHFSYLKTDDPKRYIENTIGKWDEMIGALFA
jgi:multicomponent Na+:H+ antiporter subunit E